MRFKQPRQPKEKTWKITYNVPCNKSFTEDVVDRRAYFIKTAPNLTVPPGLPGFYGYLEAETGRFRGVGTRLIASRDMTYYGVFNIGRQIKLLITKTIISSSKQTKYMINFSHLYKDRSYTEMVPLSERVDGSCSYNVYLQIPQLDPTKNAGYSADLRLEDSAGNAMFITLYPTNFEMESDMFGRVDFIGSVLGPDMNINDLKQISDSEPGGYNVLNVRYNSESIFNTSF